MIYPITQLGRPVLRKKAALVNKMPQAALESLVKSMIQTMRKARGVGIAAPQIGKSLRLFIVAPEPSVRYPKAPTLKPIAMINPKLVHHSKERVTDWEGCLSLPGLRGRVPRYKTVDIEFTSLDGRRLEGRLTGFVARIFQHEFDHVSGMLYIDRVEDTRTYMTEAEYRKNIRG